MTINDVTMSCPRCRRQSTPPLDGSTLTVAWFICSACNHFWSAHLRNGQPVVDADEWPGDRERTSSPAF